MDFNIQPAQYGEQRRKNILSHFGVEDNVEKALSKDDFNEKYGVGHDVFTIQDLNKFETESKEGAENVEEVSKAIEAEFKTLSPVLVKGTVNGSVETVFVRESKVEKVSTSEEEGKTLSEALGELAE